MVDHELDELRREFLDEARSKVSEMESIYRPQPDGDTLERLAYLAHQLKGAGGSYGYQSISETAAEVEKAVEELSGAGNGGAPVAADSIGHHLSELRTSVDRAAADLH